MSESTIEETLGEATKESYAGRKAVGLQAKSDEDHILYIRHTSTHPRHKSWERRRRKRCLIKGKGVRYGGAEKAVRLCQFQWSLWLKAPRTGATGTVACITRIFISHTLHQHSYNHVVRSEAPAQLLLFSACWVFSWKIQRCVHFLYCYHHDR